MQLLHKEHSVTHTPIIVYSQVRIPFIYTAEWSRATWNTQNCRSFETAQLIYLRDATPHSHSPMYVTLQVNKQYLLASYKIYNIAAITKFFCTRKQQQMTSVAG